MSNVDEAEKLKASGNSYFQKGDLDNAIENYTQALKHLENSTPSQHKLLKCIILSNRVACYLKQPPTKELLDTCINDCTIGINEVQSIPSTLVEKKAIDSIREKLLYRRAKSRYEIKTKQSLNDAARDVMEVLQIEKTNVLAQTLLRSIKERHGEIERESSPLGRALLKLAQEEENVNKGNATDDRINNLKLVYHIISQDVASNSMQLGRNKKHGIHLLMSIALDKENVAPTAVSQEVLDTNAKCRSLALQILSACCSHVPFVQNFYMYIRFSDLATIVMESTPHDPDVIISTIAVLLRLILTLTDEEYNEVYTTASSSICTICITTLTAFTSDNKDTIRIQHAIFDLLTAWCSTNTESILKSAQDIDTTFLENTHQEKYYTLKHALHHKSEEEIRKMKPRELSSYKQQEYQYMHAVKRRACQNAVLFCNSETGGLDVLLNHAIQIQNYSSRREIVIVICKLFSAMDVDDEKEDVCQERIKEIVSPILNGNGESEEMKYEYDGVVIEEINEDNDESSIKSLMIKCQLTSCLLLSVSSVGIWVLEKLQHSLQTLINSNNKTAMSLASECLSSAASIEKARSIITPLVQNEILQPLLKSDDGDIRSGAASTLAKLGLADKVVGSDEGEIMGLLQLAADLLEEDTTDTTTRLVKQTTSSTTIERAIELLTYLCSKTSIKEEIIHGFQSSKSATTVLQRLVSLSNDPNINQVSYCYGLSTCFANIAVSIETLKKEAFAGKDITPEQYEQLQSMTLTEEEKEMQESNKEVDDPKDVLVRVVKMAQCGVASALVHMIDKGVSEATLDQVILTLLRMAVEPSIRGSMIQQGVLKACTSLQTSDTEKGKVIIQNARHVIAKLLVTTNPSLLTPIQRIGSIKPLIELIRNHTSTDLAIFEALLSICNLASLDEEMKNRIVKERGIATLSYAMFSDHGEVRRAATEAMSNLVPNEEMMMYLSDGEKLRLWLAFASDFDENYECARAAAGCLANATQDSKIANELAKLPHFHQQIRSLLECGHLELMHRLFVILSNMLSHGGKCRSAVEATGAISFCKAYLDSYCEGNKKDELEFSAKDRQLMDVTLDLSKEIVNYE